MIEVEARPGAGKCSSKSKSRVPEWNGGEDWAMAEGDIFTDGDADDWLGYDEDEQKILDQLGALRAARAGGKPSGIGVSPDEPMDWQTALLFKKGKGKTTQMPLANAKASPTTKLTVVADAINMAEVKAPVTKSSMWGRTDKEKKADRKDKKNKKTTRKEMKKKSRKDKKKRKRNSCSSSSFSSSSSTVSVKAKKAVFRLNPKEGGDKRRTNYWILLERTQAPSQLSCCRSYRMLLGRKESKPPGPKINGPLQPSTIIIESWSKTSALRRVCCGKPRRCQLRWTYWRQIGLAKQRTWWHNDWWPLSS